LATPPPPPPPPPPGSPFGKFQLVGLLATAMLALLVVAGALQPSGDQSAKFESERSPDRFPAAASSDDLPRDRRFEQLRGQEAEQRRDARGDESARAGSRVGSLPTEEREYEDCIMSGGKRSLCEILRGPGSRPARKIWRECRVTTPSAERRYCLLVLRELPPRWR
jgi:hypothetical protein